MNTEDDRRSYFRINDEVFLRIKKLDLNSIDSIETHFHSFRKTAIITAQFHQQRTAMQPLLSQITVRDNNVATYIGMLSDQIDLLANKLLTQSLFSTDEKLKWVNISAEGMRFQTEIECSVGESLELIFAIFPGGHYIPVIAEVVRAEKEKTDGKYTVSVKFNNIDEDDKELVIHHIAYLQRQQLRNKRITG